MLKLLPGTFSRRKIYKLYIFIYKTYYMSQSDMVKYVFQEQANLFSGARVGVDGISIFSRFIQSCQIYLVRYH